MSTCAGNQVERWKCYRILVVVVFLLIIIISSTLLSFGYDGHYTEGSSIITFIRHDDKTPMAPVKELSLSNATQEKIQSISLTISTMKLPRYDKSFRNPCWHERWYNGKTILRCFPYFYLAGFSKCGTTDLYFRLLNHPLIIGGIHKESHYLARGFFNKSPNKCSSKFHCGSLTFASRYFTNAARMISMTMDTKLINSTLVTTGRRNDPSLPHVRFINAFPREFLAIWKQGQRVWTYPGIAADASASTAWDYRNFRCIAENQGYDFPRNTTADWIRKIHPGAKIIMILRDPVARALSDYNMHFRRRIHASDFHQRVQESTRRIEKCIKDGKPALLCTTYKYKTRIHIGLYYYYIKSWFEKFPREQILILRFEDYIANVPQTLAKVFKFLDLPAISHDGLEFIGKSKPANMAPSKAKILAETKTLLTKFYKPFNEKLADLMRDDRFLWNER